MMPAGALRAARQRKGAGARRWGEKDKPFEGQIYTEITEATEFYPAEDYHQDYYINNPIRYKYYRYSCGRDQRLRELWGDRAGH
jgi:peptide-methionine (S)-S-oxide reductase